LKTLEKYLEDIWKYFLKQKIDDKILKNIKVSIAENMFSKNKSLEKSITIDDVNFIIKKLWTLKELSSWKNKKTKKTTKTNKNLKQLYRNWEDRIIAWVASWIANYMGIDPVIVRIIFILTMLLHGLWTIIYLILWIATPVAKTSFQKLTMRWELPNLSNITELLNNKTESNDRTFIEKVTYFPFLIIKNLFGIFKGLLGIVRIFIGIILTFITSVLLFVLHVVFLTSIFWELWTNTSSISLEIFSQIQSLDNSIIIGTSLFILIFIPLFLSLLAWIYLVFQRKMWMNTLTFTNLFLIWIVSLAIFSISIFQDYETIKNILQNITKHFEYSHWVQVEWK
jgi:phage shock protein PspC (stress-responsive transcriptional regulator)